MCLLAVPDRWGVPMLVAMWACGAGGMAIKLVGWRHARITGGVMYIGLGWIGVFVLPATWREAGAAPVIFLVLGGLIYTIGAIWLWRRWPRLVPSVFGYHEVWHACTVAAAASHAIAVWLVIS
jgi:hemolysin III